MTAYRGKNAKNIREEFRAYGLPGFAVYGIGFLKVSLATLIIIGIWVPVLTQPAAIILAILMLGAVSMHVKVKDPLRKSLPALIMFLLVAIVALLG